MDDFDFGDFSDIEAEKNSIILDTYLDSADQDYLNARWAFLNELYSNFCWSAAQTVEKYLKCILLFHEISVKDIRHNLKTAYRLVLGNCPDVIIPPFYDKGKYTTCFGKKCSDDSVESYISGLHYAGDSDVRYLQIHHATDWTDLMKLDQLVFSLRKYCQNPKPWRPDSEWEKQFPLREAQQFKTWDHVRYVHLGRLLNKLKDKFEGQDPSKSLEYHFLMLNVPFAGFVPGTAKIGSASRTAAIRRIIDLHSREMADTIVDESETAEILRWIVDNFGLSPKTRREIEDLLRQK